MHMIIAATTFNNKSSKELRVKSILAIKMEKKSALMCMCICVYIFGAKSPMAFRDVHSTGSYTQYVRIIGSLRTSLFVCNSWQLAVDTNHTAVT